MQKGPALKRLLPAVLAFLPVVAQAAPISGKVSDLTGNLLTGVCVTLTTSGGASTSDATGAWSLVTTGIESPRRSTPTLAAKHLVIDGSHVRLQFNGVDGLGRVLDEKSTLSQSQSATQFTALRSQAAGPDTLVFSWKGHIRARIPASTFLSGSIQKIDTSSANTGGACLSCSGNVTSTVCTDSVVGKNLIKNGTFNLNALSWIPITEWVAVYTADVDGKELKMDITNGSDKPWHVMLQQKNLALVAGRSYHFSIDARCPVPFNLVINLQSAPDPPTLYTAMSFPLTTTMATYTKDFTAKVSDATSVMQFNMGGQGVATIWVDNIKLIETIP